MDPSMFPSPTKTWHSDSYPSIYATRPEVSAKGKNVLVTGAGSGIGAETAYRFAEAGAARVGILGRREQSLLETKARINKEFPKTEVIAIPADFQSPEQVEKVFSQTVGNGKLDVLVSNAMGALSKDTFEEASIDEFVDSIVYNVRGNVVVAKSFIRHAAPNAVVVDISSAVAHHDMTDKFSAYGVFKTAVVRLWDDIAHSHPGYTIFHTQPGVVDTEANKVAGGVKAIGYEDHVSLPGCFNVWLASPEALFLKGKFLWSNWDIDELKARADEIKNSQLLSIDLVGWPFGKDVPALEWKD